MVDSTVVEIVRRYLKVLRDERIPASLAIVFGSAARGGTTPASDIDLLIVAPEYDKDSWSTEADMWRLTLRVDPRIEPIPVGERQMSEDDVSPLLEGARREGVIVTG